jgi:hypothetical protein
MDIAEVIGLSKGSLQTHFREELDLGRIRANFEIAKNLYKMATGPTNERTTLTAAIWWTKVRMGWRTTARVENTGKDRGPIRTKRQRGIVVILPDNGRGDARVSQPPMTDRILLQDNRHSNANEGGLSANEGDPEPDEKE